MSSAAQRALRVGSPLLLASAGWALWVWRPEDALAAVPLLLCPGWGLLRVLSVIDRHFGVIGGALCLSVLVLGLAAQAGVRAGLPPEQIGLSVHVLSLGLCLLGGLRLDAHERWRARQPPIRDPMPLWPRRTATCLLMLVIALAALTWAAPPGRPPVGSQHLAQAAQAEAWLRSGERPLLAGEAQPASHLLSAAAAALSAGSGLHSVYAIQVLCGVLLTAALLLVAEAISRLRGNRGGTRAMLALLLGLNPLALLFLLPHLTEVETWIERMAPGFAPGLTTALTPWLDAAPVALALAFTALLLSATCSVLRRASFHVPRLAGAAAFGLALCRPSAAIVLLPGWLLGIALAHLGCRDAPDNDPMPGNPARRAGDPVTIRAPFWALAVPIVAGASGGCLLAGWPALDGGVSTLAAWSLLAALGPTCLLFLPGIRHLHRSPGREAWFFVGLLLLVVPTGLMVRPAGDQGTEVVRLLALVLSVPMANGALRLIDRHGRRASLLLTTMVLFSLPGPLAVLVERATREQPLHAPLTRDAPHVEDAWFPEEFATALLEVRERAPQDAVLLPLPGLPPELAPAVALLSSRTLLAPTRPPGPPRDERSRLTDALATGEGTARLALRALPGLSARAVWAVHEGPPWPGFAIEGSIGRLSVASSPAPDVVLLTVAGLGDDTVTAGRLPELAARRGRALVFEQAVTPIPASIPALTSLMTGLAPSEHALLGRGQRWSGGTLTLAEAFGRDGFRTVAVVALEDDGGLLAGFDRTWVDAQAGAARVVESGLSTLAEADPRPLFLWLHLNDLERVADDAGYTRRLGEVDRALARMMDSVDAHDLLVLTSPYGLPTGARRAAGVLAEEHVHVPLLVMGAGLLARSSPDLVALQDLPALLLRGELPSRRSAQLWPPLEVLLQDPARTPLTALRTPTAKTILTDLSRGSEGPVGLALVLDGSGERSSGRPPDASTLARLEAVYRSAFRAASDR
jgi:hypothetical protein